MKLILHPKHDKDEFTLLIDNYRYYQFFPYQRMPNRIIKNIRQVTDPKYQKKKYFLLKEHEKDRFIFELLKASYQNKTC